MFKSKTAIRSMCLLDYILTLLVLMFPILLMLAILLFVIKSIVWKFVLAYNISVMLAFLAMFVGYLLKSEKATLKELKQCFNIYYPNIKTISFLHEDNTNCVNVIFYKKNYDGVRGVERLIFWNPKFFFNTSIEMILKTLDQEFFENRQDIVVIQFEKKDVNEKQLQKYCISNQNGEYCWL